MTSNTPIKDRAKRIRRIRQSRKRWPWDEHSGASWDFRVLDVLWDIRGLLVAILLTLILILYKIG